MPPADTDDPVDERAFAARLAEVAAIAEFVRATCARHALPAPVALRSTLVLEELFSNTVRHGHGGDSDAIVHIALRAGLGRLHLVYLDHAPPFDPIAAARPPADLPLPERPVGSLGLVLTAGLARQARYRRIDGGNRIELTIDALPLGRPDPVR